MAASLLFGVAACSTRVENTTNQGQTTQQAPAAMPRPQQVIVQDFTTDHARLQLDQGIGPRLERTLQGDNPAADQQQMLSDVRNAIADTLVASIQQMGLPAKRGSDASAVDGNAIVVRGQLVRVDQGNRTRRLGIGFGAGMSDVSARVQVLYQPPGAPTQVLQTYSADSNSGRKPGLAAGAASAAEGTVAPAVLSAATGVSAERHKTEVAKEGEKLANRVAYNLGGFFARQGWISESAVPTPSLR